MRDCSFRHRAEYFADVRLCRNDTPGIFCVDCLDGFPGYGKAGDGRDAAEQAKEPSGQAGEVRKSILRMPDRDCLCERKVRI